MNKINKLEVFYNNRKVGTLALLDNKYCAFEYDDDWLIDGFSISPFSLPLEKKVFIPKIDPFEGLFGVFSDSLPDGWGRLLVDRLMLKKGIDPYTLNNLDRLAIVGDSGMGALSYRPIIPIDGQDDKKELDIIARGCFDILNAKECADLDYLFKMGGSSGGARPKILTKIENKDWIIKFPSTYDDKNIGKQEYDYALCAKKCGIDVSNIKLFPSNVCSGYFGTKRFDRDDNGNKIHMISVSALLETSHRIPNLDYNILMKLTLKLTKSLDECEKLFRLMCFNVYAHNRDDHSKNFSFLYKDGKWKLSPAYDLTYSNSLYGQHATTINRNGKNPNINDILAVSDNIGLDNTFSKKIALEIKDKVNNQLKEYLK